MTLEEAIAEVQAVTRVTYPWTGDDFTCAQPEHDPTKTDNAIATILNAVASGDLIPLAEHRLAVALAYQNASDFVGALENACTDEGVKMWARDRKSAILALADTDALAEVQALREQVERLREGEARLSRLLNENAPFEFDRYIKGVLMAEGVTVIGARNLASAMRIAATLAARGPRGETPVLVYRPNAARAEAAEAEVARLREALEDIADGMGETELVEIGRFAPVAARAALQPKAAT